jgi:two-component system, chemotaxis family, response regulator Rcp1
MRTIRLLVVEDSQSFQFLIREAFRARGDIRWELTMANDVEEAVRLLFEEENENVPLPNLILLDWNLPKIDGGEVLRPHQAPSTVAQNPGASVFLIPSR